jgi:hypothetical protein
LPDTRFAEDVRESSRSLVDKSKRQKCGQWPDGREGNPRGKCRKDEGSAISCKTVFIWSARIDCSKKTVGQRLIVDRQRQIRRGKICEEMKLATPIT